ncbi:MAG: hypothetical protein GY884_35215 [Proteobacteria bacterium]|nr:hypothetical protein [Pseudomonadota bacterium]
MLLLLIPLADAGRDVSVTWQEARVEDVQLAAHGVEVIVEVRDICSFEIQNLWYFELYSESDRPCSDWRPLTAEEPERRLMAEPARTARPIRGPVVAGQRHSMTATVTTPAALAGSTVEARFESATLVLDGQDLGAALVLADLQREDAPSLSLALDGRMVDEPDAVGLRWQVSNRKELVDAYALSLDAQAFPLVAEEWRCAALSAIEPSEYLILSEPGLLAGYAVATCDDAAKAQGPALCTAAAGELTNATVVAAEATRAWVEPVLDRCGADFTNAARAHVTRHYAVAIGRGDLGDAARLVEIWAAEMGEEWTAEATTQVDELIRDQIPARFDWALRNGATAQAQELFDTYAGVLGPEWTAKAEERLK